MPDPGGRPAVFLDRDGTLIEDAGCLRDPEGVVLVPQTVEALSRLRERFLLFLITNQVWIGRGMMTHAEAEAVNNRVRDRLADRGIGFAAMYICPHEREENCLCRKPRPHFLHRAARDFGVDVERSYSVGDHLSDVDLCRNAGGRGVFVLTGHGASHQGEIPPGVPVGRHIGEAADWILAHADGRIVTA